MRKNKLATRFGAGALVVALTSGGAVLLTGLANAAPPPPGSLGTLAMSPATGDNNTIQSGRTSAPCAAASDAAYMAVTGPVGDADPTFPSTTPFNITTAQSTSFSTATAFTVAGGRSMQSAANNRGKQLKAGRYDFTVVCVNSETLEELGDFRGAIYFTSPTAWQVADPSAVTPTPVPVTPTPVPVTPTPVPVTPTPVPVTPTPVPVTPTPTPVPVTPTPVPVTPTPVPVTPTPVPVTPTPVPVTPTPVPVTPTPVPVTPTPVPVTPTPVPVTPTPVPVTPTPVPVTPTPVPVTPTPVPVTPTPTPVPVTPVPVTPTPSPSPAPNATPTNTILYGIPTVSFGPGFQVVFGLDLNAIVVPLPAGTVQFKDGTTNLGGPVTVSSGTATLHLSNVTFGHTYTAVFTPANPAAFGPSTSNPFVF